MKTIIFCNQKGGVGKTTLCRNLGWYLSEQGISVLLIDLDPQGNLTKSFFDEETLDVGTYEALVGGEFRPRAITENLSLVTGDGRLTLLNKQLGVEIDGCSRLKECLAAQNLRGFELIFIDSPPSLEALTANGLTAAEALLIPMNPSLFSMQGSNDLMATVFKVKKTFNPDLYVLGFLINAYESIPVISRQIREEIHEAFGEKVFSTTIPKSIKIEESIVARCGVTGLAERGVSKIQEAVEALGDELLGKVGYHLHEVG